MKKSEEEKRHEKSYIVCAVLALFMVFAGCMGYRTEVYAAATKTYGDYEYCYSKKYQGIELLKYHGQERTVNVLAQVEGIDVTVIGEACFEKNEDICEVTLPDTIIRLEDYAFYKCIEMQKIQLSDNLKTLGESVFEGCKNLQSICVPETVASIGNYAFGSCEKLEKAVLPEQLTVISYGMFYASGLKNIKLPSRLTRIEMFAFGACQLTTIEIPKSVKKIGYGAFQECEYLEKVNFAPDAKLKSMESDVFSRCEALKKIKFPASLEKVSRGGMFVYSGIEKVSFAPDAKIKEIPPYFFCGCPYLKEVEIPKNVTKLGEELFANNLEDEGKGKTPTTRIRFLGGKIKKIGKNAFKDVNKKAVFFVPAKYKKAYKKLLTQQTWYRSTMKIK